MPKRPSAYNNIIEANQNEKNRTAAREENPNEYDVDEFKE